MIFIRLRHADPHTDDSILPIQAVRISNFIYVSETVFLFELAKGFTRSVFNSPTIPSVPDGVIKAPVYINAKQKLNLILHSHTFNKDMVKAGAMVQVYPKDDKTKCGTWSSPRIILSMNQEAGFVVVPERESKRLPVAFGDSLVVHDDIAITNQVQYDIYEPKEYVSELLNVSAECETPPSFAQVTNVISPEDTCSFSSEVPVRTDTVAKIKIFWPDGNEYYSGAVNEVREDGKCVIINEDDEKEVANMSEGTWHFDYSTLHEAAINLNNTIQFNEWLLTWFLTQQHGQQPFLRHKA